VVGGYTDNTPVGSQTAGISNNLDLSCKRAASVVSYLISQGIYPNLLQAQCFGATHLCMGPRRYIYLRPIQFVRRALRNAGPDETRVAQVARQYGFARLGRFAMAYPEQFGKLPSVTLLSRIGPGYSSFGTAPQGPTTHPKCVITLSWTATRWSQ
jgi:hypothetical protein